MHLIFEETLDCLFCKSESQTVIHGSFLQRAEILMDATSFDKVELLAEVSILRWLTIFQVFQEDEASCSSENTLGRTDGESSVWNY